MEVIGLINFSKYYAGTVVSGTEELTGYSAYSDPSGRVCGLTILTTAEEDIGGGGQWN